MRQVCPACSRIAYRNPLPVASSVVLDEQRRVLLVKRAEEPQKGHWCLPIGFAELDESIAEAALRELREETGIEGEVLRLLDADSTHSDLYGDLLVVSFEVRPLPGKPRPGDDAQDAAWFALDELPPLAFPSNDKALALCLRLHEDDWAIQDSFQRLHSDSSALVFDHEQAQPGALLSDALVALVRHRARQIAALWLQDVRSNPTTPSYKDHDAQDLLARAAKALSQLERWLARGEAEKEVGAFYRQLGAQRRAQGFRLAEVHSSLSLLRKHVWSFARAQGLWQRPLDVYRAMELDRRLVLFFDRASYQVTRGFEGEGAG